MKLEMQNQLVPVYKLDMKWASAHDTAPYTEIPL